MDTEEEPGQTSGDVLPTLKRNSYSEALENPFKDCSIAGSLTPESSARASGSEGYLGDDDADLLSSNDDESDEENPLVSVSSTSTGGLLSGTNSKSTTPIRPSSRVRSLLFQEASSLSSVKKFVFGLVIVVVIAVSWVASTQTAQSTYSKKFKAPFFIIWVGTSCMGLVFPLTVPFYFILNRACITRDSIKEMWKHSTEIISPQPFKPVALLTSTILFSLIWIPTNYLFVRALASIPATDVTAIFSTAPAFVFILSIIILREPPLIIRFAAVLLAVGGIVLFSYVDGFGMASIEGVLMSVGSAIGAALYKTLLKWRVKEASVYQMSVFVSSIGVFTMILFWPIVIILHVTGVEKIESIPWIYISCSSAAGVVFNFAINFGIAYTFPLFISLGTILGVPLNAIFDAFVRNVDLLNWKITAMGLIISGFLLVLAPPSLSETITKKLCCCKGACQRGGGRCSLCCKCRRQRGESPV